MSKRRCPPPAVRIGRRLYSDTDVPETEDLEKDDYVEESTSLTPPDVNPGEGTRNAVTNTSPPHDAPITSVDCPGISGTMAGSHDGTISDFGDLPCIDYPRQEPVEDSDTASEGSSSSSGTSEDDNADGPHSAHKLSRDTSSIAVDCQSRPSQVVVKGKGVNKVRVIFPPHPPKEKGKATSGSRRSRERSTSDRDDAGASLSFSTEETCGAQTMYALPESCNDVSSTPQRPYQVEPVPGFDLNPGDSLLDKKMADNVRNGVQHFIDKIDQMRQSLATVDRLAAENDLLRYNIKNQEDVELRFTNLSNECDEMKLRVDQTEKENTKLQEQVLYQWTTRAETEELYVELQNKTSKEIQDLKNEVKALEDQLKKEKEGDKQESSLILLNEKELLNEKVLELRNMVAQLNESLSTLKAERDKLMKVSKSLSDDIINLQNQLQDKTVHYDTLIKTHSVLQNGFRDLEEQNRRLKGQLRGRRESISNTTWPLSDVNVRKTKSDKESVHYIDLPDIAGRQSRSSKTNTRQKNWSDPTDQIHALPPVPKSSK